jgi:hypothetical protein
VRLRKTTSIISRSVGIPLENSIREFVNTKKGGEVMYNLKFSLVKMYTDEYFNTQADRVEKESLDISFCCQTSRTLAPLGISESAAVCTSGCETFYIRLTASCAL